MKYLILLLLLIPIVNADINLNPLKGETQITEDMLMPSICFELLELKSDFMTYYNSNPNCEEFLSAWDTDGDWWSNDEEIRAKTDPNNKDSFPKTLLSQEYSCMDNDNICSPAKEVCFDEKGDYDTDCEDSDKDGFFNYEEFKHGTDKNDPTSGPWWSDFDGDESANLEELKLGTDPFDDFHKPGHLDSDKDGFSDKYELIVGSNVNNPNDIPESVAFFNALEQYPEPVESKINPIYGIYVLLGIVLLGLIAIPIIFIKKRKKPHMARVNELKSLAQSYKKQGYSDQQIRSSLHNYEKDQDIVDKALK